MNFLRRLFLALMLGLSASAALAGDADFTLVNRTGYPIREVYLSPTSKSAWGSDRLGSGILETTRSKLFRFSDKASCKQDLKVVFDDDSSEVVWEAFDLCAIDKITLRYNRSSGEVRADVE